MKMARQEILRILHALGEHLPPDIKIDILLIGGAAGVLTGQLPLNRTTTDCDVIFYRPETAGNTILAAVQTVAVKEKLPENWLNFEAMQLDILPHGWHTRQIHIADFGPLHVYAVSRRDLLAMKCYANHTQDREDVQVMRPTREELAFVRTYLNMLRVPSRQANLDQVQWGLEYVRSLEEALDDAGA
jgi:hypothetical protein